VISRKGLKFKNAGAVATLIENELNRVEAMYLRYVSNFQIYTDFKKQIESQGI
jgi:hypothetical protein